MPPRDINTIYEELMALYAKPVPVEAERAEFFFDNFVEFECELWIEARRSAECDPQVPALAVLAIASLSDLIAKLAHYGEPRIGDRMDSAKAVKRLIDETARLRAEREAAQR